MNICVKFHSIFEALIHFNCWIKVSKVERLIVLIEYLLGKRLRFVRWLIFYIYIRSLGDFDEWKIISDARINSFCVIYSEKSRRAIKRWLFFKHFDAFAFYCDLSWVLLRMNLKINGFINPKVKKQNFIQKYNVLFNIHSCYFKLIL